MQSTTELKINKGELDVLYRSYGFEVDNSYKEIGVFLYKKGRYFGVDIIPLIADKKAIELANSEKDKYSDLGYAASVKKYCSINEAHIELFKSFFSYDSTLARLNRKYGSFQSKQTRNLLGTRYEYIDVPFDTIGNLEAPATNKLTNTVINLISDRDPRLIIIEAAAGYGKTCTAYELLNILTQKQENIKVPIFTELARNRSASIFRYILLDEIDIEYPNLSSELVLTEIKTGRIPLIIDGFDELLDKVNKDNISSSFEEVESMLDTIGNLLVGEAKVILTTRKTAIFSGFEFEKWIDKWENKFKTSRFSIKDPRIKDWLGEERYKQIKERNVPIQHIANPVILSYLKSLNFAEFQKQVSNPETLIQEYFNRMLEREKERQNLIITADKQYEIFKNVVKLLLEFDITSESKEFFKDIIKDQNTKLLEYTRTLYSGSNKPTLENLVDSLATHALLDRKGRNEDQIGFINDFVLGNFIGEIIVNGKIEKEYSAFMIELAATAYKVQSKKNRAALWDKIKLVPEKFAEISLFNFDIVLQNKLTKNYEGLSVEDQQFIEIKFDAFSIANTVFMNCAFKSCVFNPNLLQGISFIGCTFDSCEVEKEIYLDKQNDIFSIKCFEKNCHILQYNKNAYDLEGGRRFTGDELKVFKTLLECKASGTYIMKFLGIFNKQELKGITNAIISLETKGYLLINDSSYIIYNMNKLPEIKSLISVN